MTDIQSFSNDLAGSGKHFSFVLRCRIEKPGRIHGRLIDVSTGNEHPFTDLAELPSLVKRLSQEGSLPSAKEDLDRS